MKIIRLLLILAVAIGISFFSWSYYTGKSLQEKHERAKLVYEESCGTIKINDWRGFYVYE